MTIPTVEVVVNAFRMMTLSDAIGYLLILGAAGSLIIQKVTGNQKNIIKVIFGYFGDLLFGSMSDKIDDLKSSLESKIDVIQEQTEKNAKDLSDFKEEVFKDRAEERRARKEDRAKQLRSDILCFADAIKSNPNGYSQRHYENILHEMQDYEELCVEAQVKNHVLGVAEDSIRNQYKENISTNGFL